MTTRTLVLIFGYQALLFHKAEQTHRAPSSEDFNFISKTLVTMEAPMISGVLSG